MNMAGVVAIPNCATLTPWLARPATIDASRSGPDSLESLPICMEKWTWSHAHISIKAGSGVSQSLMDNMCRSGLQCTVEVQVLYEQLTEICSEFGGTWRVCDNQLANPTPM